MINYSKPYQVAFDFSAFFFCFFIKKYELELYLILKCLCNARRGNESYSYKIWSKIVLFWINKSKGLAFQVRFSSLCFWIVGKEKAILCVCSLFLLKLLLTIFRFPIKITIKNSSTKPVDFGKKIILSLFMLWRYLCCVLSKCQQSSDRNRIASLWPKNVDF